MCASGSCKLSVYCTYVTTARSGLFKAPTAANASETSSNELIPRVFRLDEERKCESFQEVCVTLSMYRVYWVGVVCRQVGRLHSM